MSKKNSRDFKQPDETRMFKEHGHFDILKFGEGMSIGRGVFEPNWKWSKDVKPIAGTETCEASHSGYCTSGSMTIRMNNGEEFKIEAGQAYHIPPGHDAWVEGSDPCVLIDVMSGESYAKKAAA